MCDFRPLIPWTPRTRQAVKEVATHLDPLDRQELSGIRHCGVDPESIAADVGRVIREGMLLDGFVAFEDQTPVAVAFAFQGDLPRTAALALVGRAKRRRAMVEVYREIERRSHTFGEEHGVAVAELPILADHRAARRKARETGGVETFEYGPIGLQGQSYVHTVWRW